MFKLSKSAGTHRSGLSFLELTTMFLVLQLNQDGAEWEMAEEAEAA